MGAPAMLLGAPSNSPKEKYDKLKSLTHPRSIHSSAYL